MFDSDYIEKNVVNRTLFGNVQKLSNEKLSYRCRKILKSVDSFHGSFCYFFNTVRTDKLCRLVKRFNGKFSETKAPELKLFDSRINSNAQLQQFSTLYYVRVVVPAVWPAKSSRHFRTRKGLEKKRDARCYIIVFFVRLSRRFCCCRLRVVVSNVRCL